MKFQRFVQRTDHMARHNLLKFLFYSCNQLCVYTSFVHSKSWYITVKVLIPLRLALRGRDLALNQPILPFKSQKIHSNIKKYPLFLFSTDFVTISLQLLMFCQILEYRDIQHIFSLSVQIDELSRNRTIIITYLIMWESLYFVIINHFGRH